MKNSASSRPGEAITCPTRRVCRAAFVLECTLGHVTFAKMLQRVVPRDSSVQATWLLVEPGTEGWPADRFPLSTNYTLRTSTWARRLLGRADNYDVVFFHTQTLALLSAWSIGRTPLVISLDATPTNIDEVAVGYAHRESGMLAERAKRALLAATFKRAAYLIAWSNWCARSLKDDYGARAAQVKLVRPGVDLAAWQADDAAHSGPLRILFVGGDFDRKGGGDLVVALSGLECDWECDVVTRSVLDIPTYAGRLRVHRDLTPGHEGLRALYRGADVFVLPTRGDANSWAVMEAMASGLPVVGTRVGAVPELVIDGETGLLTEPGDVAALASALQNLADDPAGRRHMGAAGRMRATERFDEEVNGPMLINLVKLAAARTSQA